jgi:hypothetical protein
MNSLDEIRLPGNFLESVGIVNTAADAAAARVKGSPAAMGDITADVDRVAILLIDNIKSRWIRAIASQNFANVWLPEWNPSDLHRAATALSRNAANMSVPSDLAIIIDNTAHLKEQARAWLTFVRQHNVHSHFTASLKLVEAGYDAMRSAAQLADLIQLSLRDGHHHGVTAEFEASLRVVDDILHLLDDDWAALYLCRIKPMMTEGCDKLRNQDTQLLKRPAAPTYVGFESLGEVGSEPSFKLACHLACSAVAYAE